MTDKTTKKQLLQETPADAAIALQGYFKMLLELKIFCEVLYFSVNNETWLDSVLKNLRVAGVQIEKISQKSRIKVIFKF